MKTFLITKSICNDLRLPEIIAIFLMAPPSLLTYRKTTDDYKLEIMVEKMIESMKLIYSRILVIQSLYINNYKNV